jgi:hypothetical protein
MRWFTEAPIQSGWGFRCRIIAAEELVASRRRGRNRYAATGAKGSGMHREQSQRRPQ